MQFWRKQSKSRRQKQATVIFKVMVWIAFGYTVIAALHGAAPQMWSHHVNHRGDSGPFRILLFTLFTAIAMAIIALALGTASTVVSLPSQPPRTSTFKSPWLLRGPPLS